MDLTKAVDDYVEHGARYTAAHHPAAWVRYKRGIMKTGEMLKPTWVDGTKRRVVIRWGASGAGKTYDTLAGLNPEDIYYKSATDPFFDGYFRQKHIVVENFNGGWGIALWKQVCDENGVTVETKRGSVALLHESITFTSNCDWRLWYLGAGAGNMAGFKRRLTEVWRYKGVYPTATKTDDKQYGVYADATDDK